MSTGTNRERLEQNNTLLEDIKTQIQNLPEAGSSSGVKLFAAVEEMQSDPTAKEGDMAIVYRSEMQNAAVDSHFQIATFPNTVVLDTAITDSISVGYMAVDSSVMFDCWGSLDSSSFMMSCSTESDSINIEYTSSDGITYTRTDTTGNPVDFGTEIYYAYPSSWNDAIGKFTQVSGNVFEGLFEYKNYTNPNAITAGLFNASSKSYCNLLQIPLSDAITSRQNVYVIPKELSAVDAKNNLYNIIKATVYYTSDDGYVSDRLFKSPARAGLAFRYRGDDIPIIKREIDFTKENIITSEHILTESEINAGEKFSSGSIVLYVYDDTLFNNDIIKLCINKGVLSISTDIPYNNMSNDTLPLSNWSNNGVAAKQTNPTYLTYDYASTQLSLSNSNQLLPDVVGYGKSGVFTGDGTIYDKLDDNDIKKILGINNDDIFGLLNSDISGKSVDVTYLGNNDEYLYMDKYISRFYITTELYNLLNERYPNNTFKIGSTLTYHNNYDRLTFPNKTLFTVGTYNDKKIFAIFDFEALTWDVFDIITTKTITVWLYTNKYVYMCLSDAFIRHDFVNNTDSTISYDVSNTNNVVVSDDGSKLVGLKNSNLYIIDFENKTSKSVTITGNNNYPFATVIPNTDTFLVFSLKTYNPYVYNIDKFDFNGNKLKTYSTISASANGNMRKGAVDYSVDGEITQFIGGDWNKNLLVVKYNISTDSIDYCKNSTTISNFPTKRIFKKISGTEYILFDSNLNCVKVTLNYTTNSMTTEKLTFDKSINSGSIAYSILKDNFICDYTSLPIGVVFAKLRTGVIFTNVLPTISPISQYEKV